MTSVPVDPQQWSAGRWWTVILVVFALHLLLIVWLEDRSPGMSRKPAATPAFRLSDGRMAEWLATEDPTLFALPNRHGFSGEAWLTPHSPQFHPAEWSGAARTLPLDSEQLGTRFLEFVHTNAPGSFPILGGLKPDVAVPEPFPIGPPPGASRLRIEGELAGRRLLAPLQLPALTNTDLLINSVVQLVVDARGRTVSAVLLPPGSVLNEADQRALDLAKGARFEARDTGGARFTNPSAGLSIGTMIFEWQPVLAASSNAPSVTP